MLLACHDCDLLHDVGDMDPGMVARCRRCGATLRLAGKDTLGKLLPIVLAALVAFVVANSFPFLAMELTGQVNRTTLAGGAMALWQEDYALLGTLVWFTTIVAPGAQIALLLWVLAPLSRGRLPWRARTAFRTIQHLRPWGMAEVFLLGIVVSVVKIAADARVYPGPALWALGALVLLLATSTVLLDPADLWRRFEEQRR